MARGTRRSSLATSAISRQRSDTGSYPDAESTSRFTGIGIPLNSFSILGLLVEAGERL